jgi:hypothetical protein
MQLSARTVDGRARLLDRQKMAALIAYDLD